MTPKTKILNVEHEPYEKRQKIAPLTPFIFVSGTVGQEKSVELIKKGATDFALKDKLYSLTTKVTRSLRKLRS